MDKNKINNYTDFFKAISNETRLGLVLLLSKQDYCLCDLVKEFNIDASVISRHLKQLTKSKILSSRRDGKKVIYKLEMTCILSFLNCIDSKE